MAWSLTAFRSYCCSFRLLVYYGFSSFVSILVVSTIHWLWLGKPLELVNGLEGMNWVFLHFVILVSAIITAKDFTRN